MFVLAHWWDELEHRRLKLRKSDWFLICCFQCQEPVNLQANIGKWFFECLEKCEHLLFRDNCGGRLSDMNKSSRTLDFVLSLFSQLQNKSHRGWSAGCIMVFGSQLSSNVDDEHWCFKNSWQIRAWMEKNWISQQGANKWLLINNRNRVALPWSLLDAFARPITARNITFKVYFRPILILCHKLQS